MTKTELKARFSRFMRRFYKMLGLIPTREKDLKRASTCDTIVLKSNPLSNDFRRKWKKFDIYLSDFHRSKLFLKKGETPRKKYSQDTYVTEFAKYLAREEAYAKPDIFETSRCRLTALDNGRVKVELFKKNGLPHSSFEVVKIRVNDLYAKKMGERTFYAITNNKGQFAKKLGLFRYVSKKAKLILGSVSSSTNVYLNVKKFMLVPQNSYHEFGNQNLIEAKGFVCNNYYNLLETSAFDFLYEQVSNVHKKWDKKETRPRLSKIC
jgi:hypothetical protein